MFLLRKLVIYFRQLPAQTAHSIFNYLVRWQHDNHVFSYVFMCERVLPPTPTHTQSLSLCVTLSLSPYSVSFSLSLTLSVSVCLSVSLLVGKLEI